MLVDGFVRGCAMDWLPESDTSGHSASSMLGSFVDVGFLGWKEGYGAMSGLIVLWLARSGVLRS